MIGLGTIVNVALIVVGSLLGLVLKKVLPQRITDAVLQALGLAVVVVGVSGVFTSSLFVSGEQISSQYTLIMIVSLALGALLGELIKIEDRLNSVVKRFEGRLSPQGSTFTQGFVMATLVFCVGSMSIVGSIEDGINGNASILYTKSAMDAVSSMIFASTLGIGVLFSAIPVAVYQGLITLLAMFIAPYLNAEVINQMSVIGSVLIIGTGLNMLKVTKIKVGNLLPSIFIPVVYYLIRSLWESIM